MTKNLYKIIYDDREIEYAELIYMRNFIRIRNKKD
jgi:hypothetical protein